MICYNKLFVMLKQKNISSYKIKKDNIISQQTLQNMRHNKPINTETIDKLCSILNCQPGDILEYIKTEG